MANSSDLVYQEFNNPNLEPLLSSEQIQGRILELGAEITRDYAGKNPLLVCLLKESFVFLSDLVRAIDIRVALEFMAVSSYGLPNVSREVRIIKDLDVPVEGRDVIIIDVMVDTGLTLSYLVANLSSRGARSVKAVTLLDVTEGRMRAVEIAYCGYTVPNIPVVGYGIDFGGRYSNLPYIAALKESNTQPGLLIPSI